MSTRRAAGTLKSASGFYDPVLQSADVAQCSAADQASGACSAGDFKYREYIRRPDQQIFSVLTGARHDLPRDVITYDVAVSRGHNIGGQLFSTIYFTGPQNVTFQEDQSNPYRPHWNEHLIIGFCVCVE